jgi:transposase-like protein
MYVITFEYCPFCQRQHFVEMHFIEEDYLQVQYYYCPTVKKTFQKTTEKLDS